MRPHHESLNHLIPETAIFGLGRLGDRHEYGLLIDDQPIQRGSTRLEDGWSPICGGHGDGRGFC